MPNRKSILLIPILSVILGCNNFAPRAGSTENQVTNHTTQQLKIETLFGSAKTDGVAIKALSSNKKVSQQRYATTSKNQGLSIINSNGEIISQQQGNFSGLDIRKNYPLNNKETHIISAIEVETNSLKLYKWTESTDRLDPIFQHNFEAFQLDSLCLYHNPDSNHLYAFLLTPYGAAEQWLLIDGLQQYVDAVKVRELKIGTEAEYCTADDINKTVYFSEEAVGIWQYPAEPESKNTRALIAGLTPNGHLENPAAAIQILEPGLLAASEIGIEETSGLIHLYQIDGEKYLERSSYELENQLEIESISSLRLSEEKLKLSFYESKSDQFITSILTHKKANATTPKPIVIVNAKAETPPVDRAGDAADDPAIWIHPEDASRSLIIGTHKRLGLLIYDITGNEKQSLAVGRLNNVDLRYGFPIDGESSVDIVAASNRSNNHISLFSVSSETTEVNLISQIPTNLDDVYGLCMHHQKESNQFYVFINDKDGRFQQYELKGIGGNIEGTLVREFALNSQPEGCVVDDDTGRIYIGEEDVGVWTTATRPQSPDTIQLVAKVGEHLSADVEGLALYQAESKYLVVSSQGDNSYVLFKPEAPYEYIGTFRIALNGKTKIDGASDTDGIEVTSANLGGDYSEGMLVVQDGFNVMPPQPQNFKIVPWKLIKEGLDL